MKAVIFSKYWPLEVLHIQEVSKPSSKGNQILIKIVARAINSGDIRVRGLITKWIIKVFMRLIFGFSKQRTPILGSVFSGVVESIGDKVSMFKTGDEVFGMTGLKSGTYAEYIAINHKSNVI